MSFHSDYIEVVRATENNLKEVSLRIPKGVITVFTGVSGSGKSSLCLDTIAAESRRELNETFPSFVQQYLPKYGRPKVERINILDPFLGSGTTLLWCKNNEYKGVGFEMNMEYYKLCNKRIFEKDLFNQGE